MQCKFYEFKQILKHVKTLGHMLFGDVIRLMNRSEFHYFSINNKNIVHDLVGLAQDLIFIDILLVVHIFDEFLL